MLTHKIRELDENRGQILLNFLLLTHGEPSKNIKTIPKYTVTVETSQMCLNLQ